MPSYARKHQLQGSLLYHSFSRSNGRNNIFHGLGDLEHFKALLRKYTLKITSRFYHRVIM